MVFKCILFLMLLTPLINTALHSFHGGKQIKILVPLVILLFWSFLIERPFFRDILPKTSGLGSYTVTTLLLTYIAARLTREHKFLQNTSTYTLLLMGITTSLVISLFRMGYYSSPFSMFLAIVYFRLFERLSFPLWIRKVVLHMAPSMFAILIIHDNQIGTRYIHQIFHFFPLPIWGKIICTAIALFFSCLMLDIPRRLFVRLFSKQINILLNYPDKLLTEILDTQKT